MTMLLTERNLEDFLLPDTKTIDEFLEEDESELLHGIVASHQWEH